MKYLQKTASRIFSNPNGILIVAAFLLWCFAFRGFLFNQLALIKDAVPYYEHIRFFLDNIGQGVYPMWEPHRNDGVPIEFFLRRIGEFNPFYLSILIFQTLGMSFTPAYLLFLGLYYFLGMIGFYLLAKSMMRDNTSAFVAYFLLMFSSLGTKLFDSFILLIFVPMVWFFFFLVAFTQKPSRHFLLGITFCLMLVATTYLPFYFLTVFLVFLLCFGVIYFSTLKDVFKKYVKFFSTNKIFTGLCLFALIMSLAPGYLFHLETKRGEYVLPIRHAGATHDSALTVREQNLGGGGVVASVITEGLFANFRKFKLGTFYLPVFFYLILALGIFSKINRRLILFVSWGFFIYLISINDASPLYQFLYKHIFYFKYFRNFEFFLWIVLLPIIILFVVEQFRVFLNTRLVTKKEKAIRLFFLSIVHIGFSIFIYCQGDRLFLSYFVIGLSWLFFVCHSFKFVHVQEIIKHFPVVNKNRKLSRSDFLDEKNQNISKTFIFAVLVIVALQPMQVYQYLYKNSNKALKFYRYQTAHQHAHFAFANNSLLENRQINIRDLNKVSHSAKYFSVKHDYFLRKNLNIDAGLILSRLMAYDYIAPMNEMNRADIQRLGMAWAKNENIAFVSDSSVVSKEGYLGLRQKDSDLHGKILSKESSEIEILSFTVNSLKLKTYFKTPKFLVYSDSFYHDWQVFVNDQREKLYRTNIAFKGVWVPAGKNVIRFQFGTKWQYFLKYLIIGIFYCVFVFLIALCF